MQGSTSVPWVEGTYLSCRDLLTLGVLLLCSIQCRFFQLHHIPVFLTFLEETGGSNCGKPCHS